MHKSSSVQSSGELPPCCLIHDVCGYSLRQGVVFVALSAITISIITLFGSVLFLLSKPSKGMYNSNPKNAINLITALICTSASLYEIVISILMIWFLRRKQIILLLRLWDVSNLTLLTLFAFLTVVRTVIFISVQEYLRAAAYATIGIIYEVVFIYFCIIVDNYEGSLDPDIYLVC